MIYVWIALGVLAVLLVAFIWWRWTSVERGARQRDEKILKLLDPIGEKLARKESISMDDVQKIASKPHIRPMLYGMLKHFERLDLFPKEYLDVKSQAEGVLAYWMMHPNELQDAPEQMEFLEVVTRQMDGENAEFFVFRYKMAQGHWAAERGWLLGLAGPFFQNDVPYTVAAGFSRSDKVGEVKPAELIDWYVDVVEQKTR